MIISINILDFILKGSINDEILIGMPISKIKKKYGKPTNVYGDDQVGYLEFRHVRIGYHKKYVDEIAILFNKEFAEFGINVASLPLINSINSGTKTTEIIQILNNSAIVWKSQYSKYDIDYFHIRTEKDVFITIELETDRITKISCSNTKSLIDTPNYG